MWRANPEAEFDGTERKRILQFVGSVVPLRDGDYRLPAGGCSKLCVSHPAL